MTSGAQSQDYDLIVVGAGIQGAGIAHAASLQGLSVLLVERNLNAGLETSSNSSKLIHGGLRYLETLQLGLVFECLRERRSLLADMPDLVKLKPFYIPIYKGQRRKSWWVFLGLCLYSILGGLKRENRFSIIPKCQWSKLGVSLRGLSAVFKYYDAQTDDQALAQHVVQCAIRAGAEVVYGVEVKAAHIESDYYVLSLNSNTLVRAKTLVNSAGPWVNEVATSLGQAVMSRLQWVQGSHIILDIDAEEINFDGESACFYFESPADGRAFFVLPWKTKVMVGTTEVQLLSPKAMITEAEIQYLLTAFNHYFPTLSCGSVNVCDTFCGVRVLPFAEGAPNKQSRETVIVHSKEKAGRQYIAIYGGKLTSFRATANKVISALCSLSV